MLPIWQASKGYHVVNSLVDGIVKQNKNSSDLCKYQKWNGSKLAEFRRLVMSENVNVNALN